MMTITVSVSLSRALQTSTGKPWSWHTGAVILPNQDGSRNKSSQQVTGFRFRCLKTQMEGIPAASGRAGEEPEAKLMIG